MDLLYLAYYLALFAIPIVGYIVIFKKEHYSIYSIPTWYYLFKKLFAKTSIQEYLAENRQNYDKIMDKYKELPKQLLTDEDSDTIQFLSTDQKSNSVYFSMSVRRDKTARIILTIQLSDGAILQLPSKDNFVIASRATNNWCAAGFNIEICNPFKRCRFYFNGFLRKTISDGSETIEHVRLNFIWNSASRPLFYPENFNENLFLEAVCREPWRDGNWTSLLGDSVGYEQYGALIGQISFADSSKNVQLHIPTLKKRKIGLDKSLSWNRDVTFFLASESGEILHFGVTSLKYGCTHLKFGSVRHSNGVVESISDSDMFLGHLGETGSVPNAFTIHVKTSKKVFKCVFHLRDSQTSSRCREKSGFVQSVSKFEVCINTHIGTSLGIFWYQTKGDGMMQMPKPLKRALENTDKSSNYVVNLADSLCQILSLTGGKGSSLGILKSLQGDLYKVPDGFVVTTEAFRYQLEDAKKLNGGIDDLERLSKCCSDEELKGACENLSGLFVKTSIGSNISIVIQKELSKIRSSGVQFAVRSSGTIEDGDDLSCAGQNQTILGCKSESDVLEAIAKCWGSLYAFNSVKYRMQNGFPVRSDMAVVVQQLAPSEVAGVLFTCHPTESNTGQMLITANYGLGESVVSGSADVDMIVLKRTYDGQLSILSKQLGDKATRIVSDDTQAKSVERSVDAELAKQFSLTEEQALELGKVGLYLEEASGNSRDIEWGYVKDQLYLFQSRAVTTIHQWTDFELLHEFDRPVLTDLEVLTTANVGEVIPFANCALAISTVHQQLEYTFQLVLSPAGVLNEYVWSGFAMFYNHLFFDVVNTMLSQSVESYDLAAKISDLSVFGHLATKPEYIRTARERHGPISKTNRLSLLWVNMRYAWNNQYNWKQMHKYAAVFAKHLKELQTFDNSKEVLTKLQEMVLDLRQVYKLHSLSSRVSVISQLAAVITLLQRKEEFTTDIYHDISLILTSNSDNVVSAEVPRKMAELSGMILDSNLGKEFCSINKKCGMEWLKENCPKASQCLKYFLQEYGHRSFRELELYSKSWDEDPSFLIDMIQQNVKHNITVTKDRPFYSIQETFAQFKTPIKSKLTIKILKWLMSKCRKAVVIREDTKSELVRNILALRHGFYHLAKLMKRDGIIPDDELVFFFTIEELIDITYTPNPLLLSKALKRRRLFPVWNAIRFPEISEGLPKPLQVDQTISDSSSSISIVGTPACKGTITARACVIHLIQDSDQMESGDILITISTDIAWSPYFPILGGVVTELGGLISHGAVVAREYGLPCLIGAKDASRSFRTGDIVCLDTNKGTITLVSRPE